MNEIGIMQGRLSPPVSGRVQTFPWSSWEEEFTQAKTCGFDTIEWLFEEPRSVENPLWSTSGRERIRQLIADSGISLRSMCADYFMVHPFFRATADDRTRSIGVLERLIVHAASVGIRTILVPVLETCEIRTPQEKSELLNALRQPLSIADAEGISIALETELPAEDYRALIEEADHPALGVYYDAGNATSKGFDLAADVRVIGPWLRGVHVKDRRRGGGTVPLGQGDADFPAFFGALVDIRYDRPVVVQAASGDDYLGLAREYARFVREHLRQGLGRSR